MRACILRKGSNVTTQVVINQKIQINQIQSDVPSIRACTREYFSTIRENPSEGIFQESTNTQISGLSVFFYKSVIE
jgi:hypothetical protein